MKILITITTAMMLVSISTIADVLPATPRLSIRDLNGTYEIASGTCYRLSPGDQFVIVADANQILFKQSFQFRGQPGTRLLDDMVVGKSDFSNGTSEMQDLGKYVFEANDFLWSRSANNFTGQPLTLVEKKLLHVNERTNLLEIIDQVEFSSVTRCDARLVIK